MKITVSIEHDDKEFYPDFKYERILDDGISINDFLETFTQVAILETYSPKLIEEWHKDCCSELN